MNIWRMVVIIITFMRVFEMPRKHSVMISRDSRLNTDFGYMQSGYPNGWGRKFRPVYPRIISCCVWMSVIVGLFQKQAKGEQNMLYDLQPTNLKKMAHSFCRTASPLLAMRALQEVCHQNVRSKIKLNSNSNNLPYLWTKCCGTFTNAHVSYNLTSLDHVDAWGPVRTCS